MCINKEIRLFLLCLFISMPLMADETKDFNALQYYGLDSDKLSSEASKGLEYLLSGMAFHAAVPKSTVNLLEGILDKVPEALLVRTDTAEGRFKAFGRLPSYPAREAVPAGFPLDLNILKRKSPYDGNTYEFVNHNCFQCHAGVVNGLVVPGLANAHIDQASILDFSNAVSQYYSLPARPKHTSFEEEVLSEFMLENESKIKPAFKSAKTRGDNYGSYAVWNNLARWIDPETAGLKTWPIQESSSYDKYVKNDKGEYIEVPTVIPNDWWLLKYKDSIYRYADFVDQEKQAAHFAINFTSIHSEVNFHHPRHVAIIQKILAFVRQTRSPCYPKLSDAPYKGECLSGTLDEDKVKKGRALFHGETKAGYGKSPSCYKCHGEYRRMPTFTDYSAPGGWFVKYSDQIKNVKTDAEQNTLIRSFKPLMDRVEGLKAFFIGYDESIIPTGSVPDKPGYLAPPLDGVWAGAPYFHNGSVATLEQVLNSKLRPNVWQRNNEDPFSYDFEQVGLTHAPLTEDDYQGAKAKTELLQNLADMTGLSELINNNADFFEKYVGRREIPLFEEMMGIKIMPALSPQRVAFRRIYNTEEYGRSNQGHTFGDKLDSDERMAIIEFLKSLSGPNMEPWVFDSSR